MYAEKALTALLSANAPLITLVGDRIYPHALPQGCALPALVVELVTDVPQLTIDPTAGFNLNRARMQVTVLASSYPDQKNVLAAVVAACNYQRGVLASVRVNSIVRAVTGPDMTDDDRTVFHQSVDFFVTYQA